MAKDSEKAPGAPLGQQARDDTLVEDLREALMRQDSAAAELKQAQKAVKACQAAIVAAMQRGLPF